MKREIEFRGWHKANQVMLYEGWNDTVLGHKGQYFLNKAKLFEFGESVEVMQYTGLKDKNGVEIYEGDVIEAKWNDHVGLIRGEVKYQTRECGFRAWGRFPSGSLGSMMPGSNVVVLGNIYENPELLDGGNDGK